MKKDLPKITQSVYKPVKRMLDKGMSVNAIYVRTSVSPGMINAIKSGNVEVVQGKLAVEKKKDALSDYLGAMY